MDLITRMKNSLYNQALKDIIIAKDNNAPIGSFILVSCLIDCLAGFRYDVNNTRGENSENYKNFINYYFDNKYNGESIYKNLRCKLVHNYSEGGSYYFSNDENLLHNEIYNGKKFINIDTFLDDLKIAMDKYFSELETSNELQVLAKSRMDKLSILENYKINDNTKTGLYDGFGSTSYNS